MSTRCRKVLQDLAQILQDNRKSCTSSCKTCKNLARNLATFLQDFPLIILQDCLDVQESCKILALAGARLSCKILLDVLQDLVRHLARSCRISCKILQDFLQDLARFLARSCRISCIKPPIVIHAILAPHLL